MSERFKEIRELLDLIRGKTDIRTRLKEMLDPDNIKTSSILKENEVHYVSDCFWAYQAYPKIFKSLKESAETFAFTAISREGQGREHAIKLMQVTKEGGLSQFFNLREPQKEPKEDKKK